MEAIVFYLLMLQKYINSKQSSANNMKKTRLNGCAYNFSVDYKTFDTSDIIDIHKYLMKKHNIR